MFGLACKTAEGVPPAPKTRAAASSIARISVARRATETITCVEALIVDERCNTHMGLAVSERK
jgi:hypothetical protein